jgi:hypothetical protein
MSRIKKVLRPLAFTGLLIAGAAGCDAFQTVGTHQWLATRWLDQPGPQVNEVLAYWSSELHFSHDEEHGKRQLVGLAGRIMFVSPGSIKMVEANGELMIKAYDMTNAAPGTAPKKIGDWGFDPVALKKLKSEDRFGDGYTLFLPWDGYRPDIRQILLEVRYFPKDGGEIRAQPQNVAVNANPGPAPQVHVQNFTTSPLTDRR